MDKRIISFCIGLVFLATGICIADSQETDKKTEEVNKAHAAPVQGATVNPIAQAAVKAGVLSCISRINQVCNFLTTGAQKFGVCQFIPPDQPDRNIYSISMEKLGKDASFAYASASFAPNQASGCGALYEEVAWWPMSCTEVAKKHFGDMTVEGVLVKDITMLVGPPTVRVFLMPAGTGCISIKKEVIR
jgi:hypothetical protein